MENERYSGLDGLRGILILGIILMHININGGFTEGFVSREIIGQLGNLSFIFMVISAFSMCCGYYEKIIKREISVGEFYSGRYKRLFLFFALMCLIDFVLSPSGASAAEVFANLTLCFGLLPNPSFQVIGVGWFVGLVFVFYIAFPFFCYLMSSKLRCWVSFIAAVIMNLLCEHYFFKNSFIGAFSFDYRANMVYSAAFFVLGGLLYVYRKRIEKVSNNNSPVILAVLVIFTAVYIFFFKTVFTRLIIAGLVTVYGMGKGRRILGSKAARFLGGISYEMYLCHMMFYRVLEITGVIDRLSVGWISCAAVFLIVVVASMVFSLAVRSVFKFFRGKVRGKA